MEHTQNLTVHPTLPWIRPWVETIFMMYRLHFPIIFFLIFSDNVRPTRGHDVKYVTPTAAERGVNSNGCQHAHLTENGNYCIQSRRWPRWTRRPLNPLTSRPGCIPRSRYTGVRVLLFRHLKLELLTQFPASNDEKYINVVYIWRKFVSFYG